MLTRGTFQLFAIFDKPDPLDGPFFEETIYVTPSRQAGGSPAAHRRRGVATPRGRSGLHHGPVHAECRVNEHGVYVLEVAARPIGGLCSKALRFERASGGRLPSRSRKCCCVTRSARTFDGYRRESQASGVMMIPIPQRGILRGVEGVEAARAVADVDDVRITAKPDTVLVPLPEGRSYLGFIFAHGADAAAVGAGAARGARPAAVRDREGSAVSGPT